MRTLTILMSFFSLIISCESDPTEKELNEDESNYLIGRWEKVNICDSCMLFDFLPNNELIRTYIDYNYVDTVYYNYLGDDVVQIGEIGENVYDIIVYTQDSIEIKDYRVTALALDFTTVLKRLER